MGKILILTKLIEPVIHLINWPFDSQNGEKVKASIIIRDWPEVSIGQFYRFSIKRFAILA